MVERMDIWRTGDAVQIECDGRTVPGSVTLASPNSISLVLSFEAILDGHVGMMPVLRHDDGVYRSIVTQVAVRLSKKSI
jgi:hypothetical protein